MACKCVMYDACLGALIACLVLTGTLFVLMKDPAPKQQLLEALASQGIADEEVQELVQQLQGLSPERQPATSVKSQGKWRLLWSMQVCYWCHNPACTTGVCYSIHVFNACLLVLHLTYAGHQYLPKPDHTV